MVREGASERGVAVEGAHARTGEEALAARLLEVVKALAVEMAPERARVTVTLDTDLDRSLGFDSLSRVELLLRLERELDVRFSETAFSTAETPRDLLQTVSAADHAEFRPPAAPFVPQARGAIEPVPAEVDTLQGVLAWRAAHHPDRTHAMLYESAQEEPLNLTYADLHQRAQTLAGGLAARGVAPGEAVAIMLPTSRDYLESFFGVLLAGGTPVPIYPPARPSQLEDHLKRHAKILANAGATLLITVPEGRRGAGC